MEGAKRGKAPSTEQGGDLPSLPASGRVREGSDALVTRYTMDFSEQD